MSFPREKSRTTVKTVSKKCVENMNAVFYYNFTAFCNRQLRQVSLIWIRLNYMTKERCREMDSPLNYRCLSVHLRDLKSNQ